LADNADKATRIINKINQMSNTQTEVKEENENGGEDNSVN
jgi:hypothetical protein